MAGEVVDARGDLRLGRSLLQQLNRCQPVERMLQTTAAVEYAVPVRPPEPTRLVVDHLERAGTHLVDAVDSASDLERQAAAEIDLHRRRLRERLVARLQRTSERQLEGYRCSAG